MTRFRTLSRHLTPSLFISLLALVIATSSGAYALSTLRAGEVHTRHLASGAVTTPKLDGGAVTSSKVRNFGLRLIDLGGKDHAQTATTSQPLAIPAGECRQTFLDLYNPAPPGVIGSLVVGHVTDADGGPVLSNSGVVLPTMISETSQGGAIANLVVCASGNESIPAGSVFHYQLIGPGK
ncbi:hypothetical protein [Nocardioides taihuensis]|uniref:Uncharacterized protein n=1 Tax=Nocardioides taihuensis TaxID=1835606 RepID=A0ABW0BLI5_9ACTN